MKLLAILTFVFFAFGSSANCSREMMSMLEWEGNIQSKFKFRECLEVRKKFDKYFDTIDNKVASAIGKRLKKEDHILLTSELENLKNEQLQSEYLNLVSFELFLELEDESICRINVNQCQDLSPCYVRLNASCLDIKGNRAVEIEEDLTLP